MSAIFESMSFEWMSGRMLEKVHKNGNTITMVYDSDGMRTHKNTVTYEYDSDKKLISMTKGSNTLLFYYDTDGNPIAVKKGNNIYYYIRNLQGDIVKIVNKLDRAIVNYEYDEWGRILSITNRQGTPITSDTNIGLLNPFRYRGYVYDDETGLYYLKSRYYDPETGRFINADIYCDTSTNIYGTNMFAYCNDNFVNQIDPEGTDAIWLQDIDSVYSFGHSSLLLEDALGNWWFTYWGDEYMAMLPYGHGTVAQFIAYINYDLETRGTCYFIYTYYSGCFDGLLYFSGDFAASLNYYSTMILAQRGTWEYNTGTNPLYHNKALVTRNVTYYNLAFNNCVQSCLDALSLGRMSPFFNGILFADDLFKTTLNSLRIVPLAIPNVVYDTLRITFPISMYVPYWLYL